MDLDPENVRILKRDDALVAVVDGKEHVVSRVARAFPKSRPGKFVGLLDLNGHEVGLIEDVSALDSDSRQLLEAELHRMYHIPRILEVMDIRTQGTTSEWRVQTDEGELTFQISDRSALDGRDAPAITITDDDGKRFRVTSFWALDDASRRLMRDLIPDRVRRSGRGRVVKRGRRRRREV